jgi:D-glycero-D-manno-heptose 1,7-bisphosphate phosphatase
MAHARRCGHRIHRGYNALRPAVFLDRDGVIVENRPDHVKSWSEVKFLDGAFASLTRLAASPFAVVVVSNQGAVGRGLMSLEQAWSVQEQIVREIERNGGRVDASYLCPHHPDAGCECRKPAPGMLRQAARELDLDMSRSWLVGDAASDLEAARAAGVCGVLVRTGRGADQEVLCPAALNGTCPVVDDLAAAVQLITETASQERIRRSGAYAP